MYTAIFDSPFISASITLLQESWAVAVQDSAMKHHDWDICAIAAVF
jgi:hypothetical protein